MSTEGDRVGEIKKTTMKEYKLRVITIAFWFTLTAYLIVEYAAPVSFVLALIGLIIMNIWICSNYPGKILKKLQDTFDKDVATLLCAFFIIGLGLSIGILALYATEPIGKQMITSFKIWPDYAHYFFIMILCPLTIATYLITRYVVNLTAQ